MNCWGEIFLYCARSIINEFLCVVFFSLLYFFSLLILTKYCSTEIIDINSEFKRSFPSIFHDNSLIEMCNDDWSLNEDSDDEVPELVHLFHADRVVNDHLNAFYGSNQSNRRMPDFAIRAQTFQFRRYPVATMTLIFEEWMTNLHSPVGVDSCHHCTVGQIFSKCE